MHFDSTTLHTMDAAEGAHRDELALFTDLYELTMLQAYFEEEMTEEAVFSLFVRKLPPRRNFLLACGLETVLDYLESLRFSEENIAYLASLEKFSTRFLDWLADFRFSGEVRAVPEGTPVFPNEPILEVKAPLPQAQLIETFVMNQIHLQTVLASKAQRMVLAADKRTVVDFGPRRALGLDAALKGARAYYIGGVAATSNVLAGKRYGLPVSGTMAHSYIQAHDSEAEAFRAFSRLYPETVLLVDTYDTLAGIDRVIDLARSLGKDFRIKAVRLDSGDLARLAREARRKLDRAGLQQVGILASGGLDEEIIASLVAAGAPIDGFGVGTELGVPKDAPALDVAYKLVEYAGTGRMKLSRGKVLLPGRKQVFRCVREGVFSHDTIGRADEDLPGRPLLQPVMRNGKCLPLAHYSLKDIRRYAQSQVAHLPEPLLQTDAAENPYGVILSPVLSAYQQEVKQRLLSIEPRRTKEGDLQ